MRLEEHSTVSAVLRRSSLPSFAGPGSADVIDAAWLRKQFLETGADDAGFVSTDHPIKLKETHHGCNNHHSD